MSYNSILICGGCSYTGGGGFNNGLIFENEFNVTHWSELVDELEWSNPKFQETIKKVCWPEKLKELTNHDLVLNCSIGAKGPLSTIEFLKESIFDFKEKYPKSKIDVIYQIPESAREEVWCEEHNRPMCLLTNLDDDSEIKKNYYYNFFNDAYSFFKQINELVLLKKMCNSIDVNLNLFSWDNKFITNSVQINELKNKIKNDSELSKKLNDIEHLHWNHLTGNVYRPKRKSVDESIKLLDIIDFDGMNITDYSIDKCKNFSFKDKYNKLGINDSHASKDGMEFIAKTLYEKIYMK
jgi:hypothetical protein